MKFDKMALTLSKCWNVHVEHFIHTNGTIDQVISDTNIAFPHAGSLSGCENYTREWNEPIYDLHFWGILKQCWNKRRWWNVIMTCWIAKRTNWARKIYRVIRFSFGLRLTIHVNFPFEWIFELH